MIKNRTEKVEIPPSLYLAMTLVVFSLCSFAALGRVGWLGVSCGMFAFWISFLSLERISRQIFAFGSVGAGVRQSLFWGSLKFLGPAGVLFVGIREKYRPLFIFGGLVVGLVTVCAVLVFVRVRQRKLLSECVL